MTTIQETGEKRYHGTGGGDAVLRSFAVKTSETANTIPKN